MKHRLCNRALAALLSVMLIIGMLPVTALAAEEIELYVGGQLITESGCYENQNGTWAKVDGTDPASGQFSYDAATFTLTLNEAEIVNYQYVTVAEGYTYDGSVIAFSQTADVSLKIVVSQGTSTITGTGGIRVESTTGNATLSIAGPGSLDVEPKGSNSGITLCSSKNVNLDIDGADVTASSSLYGVYLISYNANTASTSAITVNDGSLTTGGNYDGIYYCWLGSDNAGGTPSLTVSGNAVVDTRNSRILTNNKETGVQVGAGSDGNGGIVFNGKSGTVYGDVTLQEDLEIGKDETLTIDEDSNLIVPEGTTLTNNGTITNKGTVTIAEGGTLTNNDGSIVCNNHSGGTATCTEKAKCSFCGEEYGDFLSHKLSKTETKAPTCTEAGNEEYWYCETCKKYFSDESGTTPTTPEENVIPATGHSYGEPEWNWSKDGKSCTVTFICENDASHKETPEVKVTSVVKKFATCTETGVTTYTAAVEFNGQTYTATKDVADILAIGHSYENGKCTVCGAVDSNYKAPTENSTAKDTSTKSPATGNDSALLFAVAGAGAMALALTLISKKKRETA